MFERFTDRSRRVLVLAQEEARLLNHSFIGTEHLLLGLIHEHDGIAAQALGELGISLEAVRAKVEETIGMAGSQPTGSPPFTPRAKKVLELSLREALQLGHSYIGTEHLLLGLVREGEGVAAQVLVSLGADLGRVRQEVMLVLSGGHERQPLDVPGGPPRPELGLTGRDGSRLVIQMVGVSKDLVDLVCSVSVRAGGLSARLSARFAIGELQQLRRDLEALDESSTDEVRFEPARPWVAFVGSAAGEIVSIRGTAQDLQHPGSVLTFEFPVDRAALGFAIAELREIEDRFPPDPEEGSPA